MSRSNERKVLHSGKLTAARFEYLWQDSENFKRPTKMPAPQYVEHLMGWVQSNIDNEQMFPSRIGKRHPSKGLGSALTTYT